VFRNDPTSRVPIYAQIVSQVKADVAAGRLRPGEPLPSIRAVADSMSISPNTVVQAYRELVTLGVAEVRRGKGTFVAGAARPEPEQRGTLARALVRETIERGSRMGLSPQEIRRMVDEYVLHSGWEAREQA